MKLKEVLDESWKEYYLCWWLFPNLTFKKVSDHLFGAYLILGNLDINDIGEVYEFMYNKGYVRVAKDPYFEKISYEYRLGKMSDKQLKFLKDFSIENNFILYDDVKQKYINLLQENI